MKLVDLIGVHVEASTGSPVVLLREHDDPHRVVPIFIGGTEAAAIAMAAAGQEPPRPLTHDLMAALVRELEARLESVSVTDLIDGSFRAELTLHFPGGERHVDCRPSDAIALAVRLGSPLFVDDSVLDEAGAVVSEVPDDEEIDTTVDEFRSFLEDLDPTDFTEDPREIAPDEDRPDPDDLP